MIKDIEERCPFCDDFKYGSMTCQCTAFGEFTKPEDCGFSDESLEAIIEVMNNPERELRVVNKYDDDWDENIVHCTCGLTIEVEEGVISHCDCGRGYDGNGNLTDSRMIQETIKMPSETSYYSYDGEHSIGLKYTTKRDT